MVCRRRLRGLEELTYPFHDKTVTVTHCKRIWLVTFDETCRLEPIENSFGPKVLPMCPVCTMTPFRAVVLERELTHLTG
jgi:hypothetical protein